MRLCHATVHGEQHIDECKYRSLPAVCVLASLREQWREKRMLAQDQGADNPEAAVPL